MPRRRRCIASTGSRPCKPQGCSGRPHDPRRGIALRVGGRIEHKVLHRFHIANSLNLWHGRCICGRGLIGSNGAEPLLPRSRAGRRGAREEGMSMKKTSWCVLAAAIVAAGCGSPAGLVPVSGKVLYRGEPAAGAVVYFHRTVGARLREYADPLWHRRGRRHVLARDRGPGQRSTSRHVFRPGRVARPQGRRRHAGEGSRQPQAGQAQPGAIGPRPPGRPLFQHRQALAPRQCRGGFDAVTPVRAARLTERRDVVRSSRNGAARLLAVTWFLSNLEFLHESATTRSDPHQRASR